MHGKQFGSHPGLGAWVQVSMAWQQWRRWKTVRQAAVGPGGGHGCHAHKAVAVSQRLCVCGLGLSRWLAD